MRAKVFCISLLLYFFSQPFLVFPLAALPPHPDHNNLISDEEYLDGLRLREEQLVEAPYGNRLDELVNYWVRLSSLEKAARYYEAKRKEDPLYSVVLLEVYWRRGEIEKARSAAKPVSKRTDIRIQRMLIERLHKYGFYEEAKDWLLVTSERPSGVSLEFFMTYLDRQGRFDEAKTLLEKYLALTSETELLVDSGSYLRGLAPKLPPASEYAALYQRHFKLNELVEKYRKALKTRENDLALMNEYVEILKFTGLQNEDDEIARRLPEHPFKELLEKIRVMEGKRDFNQVIRLCRKGLEMDIPKEYLDLYTRGWAVRYSDKELRRRVHFDLLKSLGEAYLGKGNLREAKPVYEEILSERDERRQVLALKKLKEIAEKSGEEFDLDEKIKELIADRDEIYRYGDAAQLYSRMGEEKKAIEFSRKAIEFSRKAIEAVLDEGPEGGSAGRLCSMVRTLSSRFKKMGREDGQTELLNYVIQRVEKWGPGFERLDSQLMDIYAEAGKYEDAMDLLFKAVGDGKMKAYALQNSLSKGHRFARKGELIWEFYRRLEKLIGKYPDTPGYWKVWAKLYMADHQPKRALVFYKKLEADSEDAYMLLEMARAYAIRKDFENTARYRERAVLAGGRPRGMYPHLADAYKQLRKPDKAAEVYWKIISFTANPRRLRDTLKGIGYAEASAEIERRLNELVERKKALWKHHFLLAEICRARDEHEKAIGHYQIACEMNPVEYYIHERYGRFLCERQRYEDAIPVYEHCFIIDGGRRHYSVANKLLSLYKKTNKADKAISLYKRVLVERPDSERMIKEYIECTQEKGDLEDAAAFLEKLAVNYPGYDQPKEWLEKVRGMLDS